MLPTRGLSHIFGKRVSPLNKKTARINLADSISLWDYPREASLFNIVRGVLEELAKQEPEL